MLHIGMSFFGGSAGLNPNNTNEVKKQAKLLLELVPKQEWSEEDRNMLNGILLHFNASFRDMNEKEKLCFNWLQSLLERFNLQPKQEWSEEDEGMLLSIINAFRNGTVSTIGQEQWLKSLPKRFNLQPKQEWSEEDERKYQCIRNILLTDVDKKVGSWKYSEILEWYEKRGIGRYTNSQPHWKPSKEQMEALNALNCHGDLSYVGQQKQLISLYNDLKKLI